MSQKISTRQSRQHTVLPMIGNSADEALDSLLSKVDAQHGKLFEDRNMLLTGGGNCAVNTAGTSMTFSANFVLYVNQNVAGAAPYAISLSTSNSPLAFSADGRMAYLVINRTGQTATLVTDSATLPAATSANQEIVLIAKRVGTTIFLKGGFCIPAGGSSVLGRTGSVVDTEFAINDVSDPTKQIKFDASGTTGTATTLIAAQTANRSLTLPDITDTLVSRTNTEFLTNKQVGFSSANDATTTGGNATLASFTTGIVRLTNGSLLSLSGIPAGTSGQMLIIENKTGNQIAINNEQTGASAANRIQTGNGGNASMANNATYLFTYDTTTARWQLVGGTGSGSGGGGSKNYLSAVTTSQSSTPNTGNGNFESGSTNGWSLGTIGTLTNGLPTGTPTFGSGASGNLSISAVNTNTLSGSYSLSYASIAATTQGNMLASDAFNIDNESQGKVLPFRLLYKAQVNPSNGNFSGTVNNSFGVAVWDVTNSAWINTVGAFNFTQSIGIGVCSGSVQLPINTTQLRFVFYNVNPTAGAMTMYLDDFQIGPGNVDSQGPAMTDWVPYTPTWTSGGTAPTLGNGTLTGFWRRVGDSIETQIYLLFGSTTTATGSTNWLFGMPSGLTVDTTKTVSNAACGVATLTDTGVNFYNGISFSVGNGVRIQLNNTATNGQQGNPFTFATGDYLSISSKLAISGWSSNSVMSSDSDIRVVAARVQGPAGGSVANGAIAGLSTVVYDTHAATSPSRFTAPITGFYRVSGTARLSAAVTSTLYIYKNAVLDTELTGLNDTAGHAFSATIQLNAGDIIDLRPNNTVTFSALIFCIEKVTGTSIIAASESVNAMYTNQAGPSIPSATNTVLAWPTKLYDSHNAMNTSTGIYTAPVSGKYLINTQSLFNAYAAAGTNYMIINNITTGFTKYGPYQFTLANTNNWNQFASAVLDLKAGDQINVQVYQVSGSSRGLITSAGYNFIEIAKIGN